MRDVRMHRHLVAGEVVIDKEPKTLVDNELFHECRPRSHGHRTNDLTTCGLRIQNSATRANSKHATDPRFSRRRVNSDFHKMGPECRLLSCLLRREFDEVLSNDARFTRGLGK